MEAAAEAETAQAALVKDLTERFTAWNSRSLEYDALTRRAEVAKAKWSELLTRILATDVNGRNTRNSIRIVDAAAVPVKYFSPKISRTALISVAGMILFGAALALRLGARREPPAFGVPAPAMP